MFNATGYSKQYNGPDDTQGETNGLYAAITENESDDGGGGFNESGYFDASYDPTTPNDSGGGFDIGGFLANVNNLAMGVAATSRNVAASARVTRDNFKSIKRPTSFMDQFNAMPLIEKFAIGVAAFFVLRLAIHKI